jgi:hypothetical protein
MPNLIVLPELMPADKPPVHDDTYEEKGAYDSHYMYVCQRNSEDAQVPGS